MPRLVLGPIQRHPDVSRVTVWVETDAACEVLVAIAPQAGAAGAGGPGPLGRVAGRGETFEVAGHHYALVVVDGLEPGEPVPYEVWLAGAAGPPVRVWPEPDAPPSLLRPVGGVEPVRIVFGSCRVTAPQEPPYTLNADDDKQGLGTDALHALALDLPTRDPATWPGALLLLGDQVYADHVSPSTAARIRRRRDVTAPPGEEIADFEEYTWLYQEAWSQPEIRWLLSTVPTAMIFDDHDVRDDWNISAAWRAQIRTEPWWDARITGGIMAYWLYQHLGNLTPDERDRDPVHRAVVAAGTTGTGSTGGPSAEELLRAFARRADARADRAVADPDGRAVRWSFRWDLGRTRLVVIDARSARVVAADGTRAMVDAAEWAWVRQQTDHTGEVDHLLLGTSVPYLLSPLIHNVEAANEQIAAGRWGRRAAAAAERLRQALDLEHWAAFGASFDAMTELLRAVSAGEHGPAPASVVVLSGDVHHAYLARADLSKVGPAGVHAPVWQAVCSPFRNPLSPAIRRVDALSRRAPFAAVSGAFARLAGAPRRAIRWTVTDGPWFDSQLAVLELDGRAARLTLSKTEPDGTPGGLDPVLVADLTPRT
ncbi:alkaline phosphatase D family protein [Frankia sp. QA3]|uniref:alkaline phosphatase D family protein n=1 Tax=Frankia sp. QA3 TaxID=710111 RepID=UPI000269C2DD|nr:alkaline phosphatase D family protein [Frankia sp. QA3]EIV91151.1 phosphodiesterase/alkaline phosphatase D [Frankia sp. QA3]